MAQINVNNLSFSYEGSFDEIFKEVSFSIDTNWKLGFIGRNGKGKTSFLNLLLGKYEYRGSITTSTVFDYFPYVVTDRDLSLCAAELMEVWKPGVESWRALSELHLLQVDSEVFYRPFSTLSHGERTKVMLAVLFSGENDFLLIDEPTNHLDIHAREVIKNYLSMKSGFILVSHDRDLLDACIDHVLVLNRTSIEVQSGNFSSWQENKEKKDSFNQSENEKHLKEIGKLKKSVDRVSRWAEQSENSKIGYDPIKEMDRNISTRSYIGSKTKKMASRVKSFETRIEREIEEKEGLLNDIESPVDLKIMPLTHFKKTLVHARDLFISYDEKEILKDLSFDINQGEICVIHGKNGSGKSSIIKAILKRAGNELKVTGKIPSYEGVLDTASNLIISYINQDTSHLRGKLKDYALKEGVDETLLLSLLRQLDFERIQFTKNMEDFSEGQKKKVLIATSLITPAHLYIWDEPMNYIDVFSRMQIETLIKKHEMTMLLVEHDKRFCENLETKVIDI